jgi:hypothetical protein
VVRVCDVEFMAALFVLSLNQRFIFAVCFSIARLPWRRWRDRNFNSSGTYKNARLLS